VSSAVEISTGRRVYRLGRRCAADFIALLDQVLPAFPQAPVIVVICDNDRIHHVPMVTACREEHPRLELLHGARYSPHDNPVRADLGGAEELRAEHRGELTAPRAATSDPDYGRCRSPTRV
jgi:DDE superfamily endonuclease